MGFLDKLFEQKDTFRKISVMPPYCFQFTKKSQEILVSQLKIFLLLSSRLKVPPDPRIASLSLPHHDLALVVSLVLDYTDALSLISCHAHEFRHERHTPSATQGAGSA